MTSLRHHWNDGLYLMGKYPGQKCSGELSQYVTISTDRSNLQMIFLNCLKFSSRGENDSPMHSPMQCGLESFGHSIQLLRPVSSIRPVSPFSHNFDYTPKRNPDPQTKSYFSTGSAYFGAPLLGCNS